jgi:hypothetical protein
MSERLNVAVAANDHALALDYAKAIAELVPNYGHAQVTAMRMSAQSGDVESAARFARQVLALDSENPSAIRLLAQAGAVATAPPSYAQALKKALFPAASHHPLLQMRDIHDAASAILCQTSAGDDDLLRVQIALDAAQQGDFDLPTGQDFEFWRKHFRLAYRAMWPSAVFGPKPVAQWRAPQAFATAGGGALSQDGFVQAISARQPDCVFFVAADAKYIGLYAHHYIESIRRNCDVPYVVVLHVIGGAANLAAIARSLPDASGSVFLTGDDFDAASYATKCYDTPPKGYIEVPVAYYQSVRFLQLGWMLSALKRPVFVSDIDLLLQYGVSDLLAQMADRDVVFNENRVSFSAGSRLTANLTLVNPTPVGEIFAAIVKDYLDQALAGDEVSRWIDQFGLLMSWHKLRRVEPGVRVGYFDTERDINNVMYRTFEKNPFRFLSLFHGFDMNSLDKAA